MKQASRDIFQEFAENIIILGAISLLAILALTPTGESISFSRFVKPNIRCRQQLITDRFLIYPTGRTTAIDRDTGKTIWRAPIEQDTWREASCIVGNTMYLADQENLMALLVDTGQKLWETPLPASNHENGSLKGPHVSCQGKFVIASEANVIAAYRNKSGKTVWRWRTNLLGDIELTYRSYREDKPTAITRFSFITTKKHVYVNTEDNLYCLDIATGKELWKRAQLFALGCSTQSTSHITIVTHQRRTSSLVGLTTKGKTKWTHDIPPGGSPFYSRCTTVGKLALVTWSIDFKAYIDAIDVQTGKLAWRYGPFRADSLLKDGGYRFLSNFQCIYTSSVVIDNGFAYICSTDGELHQISIKTGHGKPIATLRPPPSRQQFSWLSGQAYPDNYYLDLKVPTHDIIVRQGILYLRCEYTSWGDQVIHAYDLNRRNLIWSRPAKERL